MTTHSNRRKSTAKPGKPRPDFPLFPHATGRWAKKVRGKFHYFGKVAGDEDGSEALAEWNRTAEDLRTGRTPRDKGDARLTVKALVNRFLTAKGALAETGEIARRTFRDYHVTCARIVDAFGRGAVVGELTPADFAKLKSRMARTLGLTTMGVEIMKTRAVFNWASDDDNQLIDRPARFGREFRAPTRKVLVRAKQSNGQAKRMFEADEIRRMIGAAPMPFRAMILLGVNCGYGNMDCSTLTRDALDLDGGWVNHPRPKTGVERRCPLWPETINALREAVEKRRKPIDPAYTRLVFITQKGFPWVRATKKRGSDGWHDAVWTDAVVSMTAKLLQTLGLTRKGRGFYALRHVFETIGGDSRDQVAVDALMGHSDPSMAGVYRERISDDRLRTVVDHVRAWLFSTKEAE